MPQRTPGGRVWRFLVSLPTILQFFAARLEVFVQLPQDIVSMEIHGSNELNTPAYVLVFCVHVSSFGYDWLSFVASPAFTYPVIALIHVANFPRRRRLSRDNRSCRTDFSPKDLLQQKGISSIALHWTASNSSVSFAWGGSESCSAWPEGGVREL